MFVGDNLPAVGRHQQRLGLPGTLKQACLPAKAGSG